MEKQQIHAYMHYSCLLMIIVTLPFTVLINSFVIILFGINWLFSGEYLKKENRVNLEKGLLLMFFFALYAIGLIYTNDPVQGRFSLEKRLSLLVFPLIFSTSPSLDTKIVNICLKAFCVACTLALIFCLGNAFYNYYKTNDVQHFFYHQLSSSIDMNAIYLALYTVFSLCIVAYFSIRTWRENSILNRIVCLIYMSLLILFITLLASKTLIIFIFLLGNLFCIVYFLRKKKTVIGIALSLFISFTLFVAVFKFSYVKDRFLDSVNSELTFIEQNTYTPITPFTGLSLRLTIWKFTIEILDEKKAWLLGVGTGGGQALLNEKYRQHNLYLGKTGTDDLGFIGYDTHNQYMACLLDLGIVGLIYLIVFISIPGYWAFKNNNYLHIAFLVLFSFSCLTESMLSTQKGIVFFALFQSFFTFQSRQVVPSYSS